ncbi:hypothetical protein HMP0721_1794 [Pseudoramibacter alactolyticus ATCC 23263]|uniref:Uncharacterized protein n=1 Tax=Pseudoramibacter alactolyticus ATCC 23263 TaxID=887929 RepID=E6MIF9_9FIRM|nr:hypothetical protein HMP0721_1794 [Pseudoramibacter alactolyticus ATCC 23263]
MKCVVKRLGALKMNAAGLAILVIKQHIGREPRELPGGNRVAHFFAVHLILPVETGFFPNADDVCDGNLRDDIMVKQRDAALKFQAFMGEQQGVGGIGVAQHQHEGRQHNGYGNQTEDLDTRRMTAHIDGNAGHHHDDDGDDGNGQFAVELTVVDAFLGFDRHGVSFARGRAPVFSIGLLYFKTTNSSRV